MNEQQNQYAKEIGTAAPTIKTVKKTAWKNRFTAKRLAFMAVFVALSYAVSFLEIPIFPATPYLKLDFGNVFILLISFLLGPIEGVIVCVLKESLRMIGSSSGGVGELANVAATSAYILLPSVIYRFRKGLKAVIPALIGACFIGTAAAPSRSRSPRMRSSPSCAVSVSPIRRSKSTSRSVTMSRSCPVRLPVWKAQSMR